MSAAAREPRAARVAVKRPQAARHIASVARLAAAAQVTTTQTGAEIRGERSTETERAAHPAAVAQAALDWAAVANYVYGQESYYMYGKNDYYLNGKRGQRGATRQIGRAAHTRR